MSVCLFTDVIQLGAWLASTLSGGQRVGVDPSLISAKAARDLQTSLAASHITLVGMPYLVPACCLMLMV